MPQKIKAALCQAAEIACGNVPELPGPVVIGLDVSGSMQSPVTGHRGRGATSKMRCVDVAALFAAAILRRNPDSVVIPFDDTGVPRPARSAGHDPEPGGAAGQVRRRRHELLAAAGGGQPARYRNRRFAGCVLVSDKESWIGAGRHGSTAMMTEWQEFVKNQVRLQGRDDRRPEAGVHRPAAVHDDAGAGPFATS